MLGFRTCYMDYLNALISFIKNIATENLAPQCAREISWTHKPPVGVNSNPNRWTTKAQGLWRSVWSWGMCRNSGRRCRSWRCSCFNHSIWPCLCPQESCELLFCWGGQKNEGTIFSKLRVCCRSRGFIAFSTKRHIAICAEAFATFTPVTGRSLLFWGVQEERALHSNT